MGGLKHCPFCNNRARVARADWESFHVICEGCGARTKSVRVFSDSDEHSSTVKSLNAKAKLKAMVLWNSRGLANEPL